MITIPLSELDDESFMHDSIYSFLFDIEKKQYIIHLTGGKIESGYLEDVCIEISNWSDLKVLHESGGKTSEFHIDAFILIKSIMGFEFTGNKLKLKGLCKGWNTWVFSNPSVKLCAENLKESYH